MLNAYDKKCYLPTKGAQSPQAAQKHVGKGSNHFRLSFSCPVNSLLRVSIRIFWGTGVEASDAQ